MSIFDEIAQIVGPANISTDRIECLCNSRDMSVHQGVARGHRLRQEHGAGLGHYEAGPQGQGAGDGSRLGHQHDGRRHCRSAAGSCWIST